MPYGTGAIERHLGLRTSDNNLFSSLKPKHNKYSSVKLKLRPENKTYADRVKLHLSFKMFSFPNCDALKLSRALMVPTNP